MKNGHPTTRLLGRGFTLLEVLMAVMVFAIGVVSVATLFPVSTKLQQETVEAVAVQVVARNAYATLRAKPFLLTNINRDDASGLAPKKRNVNGVANFDEKLDFVIDKPTAADDGVKPEWTDVVRLPDAWLAQGGLLTRHDRGYPAMMQANTALGGATYFGTLADTTLPKYQYYWVPVLRRNGIPAQPVDDDDPRNWPKAQQWDVLILILKGSQAVFDIDVKRSDTDLTRFDYVLDPEPYDPNPTPPDLHDNTFTTNELSPGDPVLTNEGIIYKVKSADAKGFSITSLTLETTHRVYVAKRNSLRTILKFNGETDGVVLDDVPEP